MGTIRKKVKTNIETKKLRNYRATEAEENKIKKNHKKYMKENKVEISLSRYKVMVLLAVDN